MCTGCTELVQKVAIFPKTSYTYLFWHIEIPTDIQFLGRLQSAKRRVEGGPRKGIKINHTEERTVKVGRIARFHLVRARRNCARRQIKKPKRPAADYTQSTALMSVEEALAYFAAGRRQIKETSIDGVCIIVSIEKEVTKLVARMKNAKNTFHTSAVPSRKFFEWLRETGMEIFSDFVTDLTTSTRDIVQAPKIRTANEVQEFMGRWIGSLE